MAIDRTKVIAIVTEVCGKRGVKVKVNMSESTESVYFNLYAPHASIELRVSDHKQNRKGRKYVRTFLLTGQLGKKKKQNLQRFTENSIRILNGRSNYNALNAISKEKEQK